MGSYYLLDEHLPNSKASEYVSVSPNWIMMVIPYKEPITSSKTRLARRTATDTGDVSHDLDFFKLSETKPPIIITSSCVTMDITSSKSSFAQNLNAVLKPGKVEFLSVIMPGDWCFCWIMNTREKYLEVLKKISEITTSAPEQSTSSPNGFDDGLKFVGKIHDIRKIIAQTPTGVRTVQYNMSGVGFGELESSIFFDPLLAAKESYLNKTLSDMGIAMKDVFNLAAKEGGVDVSKMTIALITALLGRGLSGVGVESGGLQKAAGASIATKEAPLAYVIPDGVAKLLGVKEPSKGGAYSYADILEVIQGIQKYRHTSFPEMFFPDGTGAGTGNRHITSYPLKGEFLPVPSAFGGKSVWNLLNEYLNPAINEMYTALKYTPGGKVSPTLTIRQLPFSSSVLGEKLDVDVTTYHELPRWVGNDLLIRTLDVGRSDGARTNFVHIYGEPSKDTQGTAMARQLALWPPVSDSLDMKRHGLRQHMSTVRCSASSITTEGPNLWMQIKSDFLLGQHMMLTGQCSMLGVTVPIAPGDNFEYDDVLYHIESVNHHVEISSDGRKSFSTQLSLTHGVRADISAALGKFSNVTKKVKGEKRLRFSVESAQKQLDEAKKDKKDKKGKKIAKTEGQLKQIAAYEAELAKRLKEKSEGIELLLGERGENLDLYFYSGIDPDDNRRLEPGLLIVDVED